MSRTKNGAYSDLGRVSHYPCNKVKYGYKGNPKSHIEVVVNTAITSGDII